VAAQVRERQAQPPRQVIEDAAEGGQVGSLAEHVQEAGEVPAVGDVLLGGDAEQAAKGRVAVQLGQAGVVFELAPGEEGVGGVGPARRTSGR
jgi:hypothetical protein